MNFTIPAADLRRMIDRLKPCRGTGPWVGRFGLWGNNEMAVTCQGETVSAVAIGFSPSSSFNSAHSPVTLPLSSIDAWLTGVDGIVTAEQDESVVTFSTDDACLPVPLAVGIEPFLPPEPTKTLPLPDEVWPALARVSWAAKALVDAQAPEWRNTLHVSHGYVWAGDDTRYALVVMNGAEAEVAFLPELSDLLREMDLEETRVTIDEDRRLHLVDGLGRYVLPTHVGPSPDMSRIPPLFKLCTTEVSMNRKELIDAIVHLRKLMARDSERVIARFEEGFCMLEVVTNDNMQATKDIPCSGTADPLSLDIADLRNALSSLSGEEVRLKIGGERCPVLMQEGGYTAIVMPRVGAAPARARDRAGAKTPKPRF